ncbi:unnamed protein product [Vitrella brassicaformis CCMP3155]|uniref:Cyclic nucleotide-binding domain-containing protein n=1 Tax=Vitrella brassicaformis (strain CCMP3155) TaxID=1169540 RepID=A0A0G4EMT7_VITBC|nr:unnamed protein product [Vitrella brassicaformis CCMP3155]|eukprot:CEL98129.1 unnamed protein product [Vitrella brassicaformis CCMP3155]
MSWKIKRASEYYARHGIQELLTNMLVELGRTLPEEPIDAMVTYLHEAKAQREAQSSATAAEKLTQGMSGLNGGRGSNTELSQRGSDAGINYDSPGEASPVHEPAGPTYTRKRRENVFSETTTDEDPDWKAPVYEKSEESKDSILKSLNKNILFAELEPEEEKVLVDAFFEITYNEGDLIIKQGDEGDQYYILEDGVCECFVRIPGKEAEYESEHGKLVFTYNPGMAFGELALMYNAPRAATIQAKTPAKVWALDRKTFKKVLQVSSQKARDVQLGFVDKFEMFSSLSRFEKLRLLEALRAEHFSEGERIIQQGDPGDAFYMIEEGECMCVVEDENGNEVECFRRLQGGDFFGELALLSNKPRAVSVDAVVDTKVYTLDAEAFERLLGPLSDVLRRNMDLYAKWMAKVKKEDEGDEQSPSSRDVDTTLSEATRSRHDDEDQEQEETDESPASRTASPEAQSIYTRNRRANVMGESLEDDADFVPPVIPKTAEDEQVIFSAVGKNVLFSHLAKEETRVIVDAMEAKHLEQGELIIKQGDDGNHWYILEDGVCECFVRIPGKEAEYESEDGKLVFTYNPGMAFGELALMYNAPRAATIQAKTPAKVWALDRKTFKKVLQQTSQATRDVQMDFINRFEMFDELSKFEKLRLLEALEARYVEAGQRIIQQGDTGHEFFMIESGECKCVVTNEHGEESECFRRLQESGTHSLGGDFFGELALLRKKPRAVSVDAVTDVKVYVLEEEAFERLLGPLEEILRRNMDNYAVYMRKLGLQIEDAGEQQAKEDEAQQYSAVSMADEGGEGQDGDAADLKSEYDESAPPSPTAASGPPPAAVRSRRANVMGESLEDDADFVPPVIPKTAEDEQVIFSAVGKNVLFSHLAKEETRVIGGDFFGELALLRKKPRAVSVDAVTDVKVYVLEEEAFERLLGPLEEILRRNMDNYAVYMKKLGLQIEDAGEQQVGTTSRMSAAPLGCIH